MASTRHPVQPDAPASPREDVPTFAALRSILDSCDNRVYVADPDTHRILFMNRALVDEFGDRTGECCFRALQGQDRPCDFCTNGRIFGENLGKQYVWEVRNLRNGAWYRCTDRAIEWSDGYYVRCEVACEITELRRGRDKLQRYSEDLRLLNDLNEQVTRGESFNTLIQYLGNETRRMFSSHAGLLVFMAPGDDSRLVASFPTFSSATVDRLREATGDEPDSLHIDLDNAERHREIFENGKPVVINEPQRIRELMLELTMSNGEAIKVDPVTDVLGIRSLISIPINMCGAPAAIMHLSRSEPFTDAELQRIAGLAPQAFGILRRKAAEDRLVRSERTYRMLAESADDFIFVVDAGFVLRYANHTCARYLGRGTADIIGKRLDELFPRSVVQSMKKNVTTVLRDGDTRSSEGRIGSGPNSRWLHTTLVPREGPDGTVNEVMGISRDLTQRRNAEHRLRESEEKFRALAEQSPNMIFMYRGDRFVYVNRKCEEMLGYSREEFYSPQFDFMTLVAPKSRESIASNHRLHLEGKDVPPVEYLLQTSDGRQFEALYTSRVIRYGDDVAVLGTVIDMTENKRAEREKEEIRAQLLEANKMEAVGTLTGGVAHDFNNLITAIKGFAGLALMDLDDSAPARDQIAQIVSACDRASGLSRQLLLFSRRQPFEPAVFSLNNTLRDFNKMLHRLIGEDIEVGLRLDESLWPVRADPGKIEQVIMNLALNARDAMPQGGSISLITENVLLTGRREAHNPRGRKGRFVRLSVRDTGTGMATTVRKRIFEPFYTTKGDSGGTGLGLSVAYGIVQQHEGWISVDSSPGEGTSFRIFLPAYGKGDVAEERKSANVQQYRGNGERILVLEDDAMVRRFAARSLSESGYEVSTAGSLKDAIGMLEKDAGKFDLVFSDVVLPDGSGMRLAEHASTLAPAIPAILSSGHLDDKAPRDTIKSRGYPFLPKPYDLEALLSTVRSTLDRVAAHDNTPS